jgi:hypothetical protein
MNGRCTGNRLISAGLIVMFIGLALVAARTWHLDGQWVPVLVGAGLVMLGVARRLGIRREDEGQRPGVSG